MTGIVRRPNPGRCRTCGAPVLWCERPNGGAVPLDERPQSDGNLVIEIHAGQPPRAVLFTPLLHHGMQRYWSHLVLCPEDEHRREP